MFLTNFTFTSQITPRKQPKDKFTLFGQASHKPLKTHNVYNTKKLKRLRERQSKTQREKINELPSSPDCFLTTVYTIVSLKQ